MTKPLVPHPVAMPLPGGFLLPIMRRSRRIFRLYGVKVPILVHGGQILDGRHRVPRPAGELGCALPWWWRWERARPRGSRSQSRNPRPSPSREGSGCTAIRKLAGQQFPETGQGRSKREAGGECQGPQGAGRRVSREGPGRRLPPGPRTGTENRGLTGQQATCTAQERSAAPYASINFVTAHDGFTMRDLVSLQPEAQRCERARGNRDGEESQPVVELRRPEGERRAIRAIKALRLQQMAATS